MNNQYKIAFFEYTRILFITIVVLASFSSLAQDNSKPDETKKLIGTLANDWTSTLGERTSNNGNNGLATDIPIVDFQKMDGRVMIWHPPTWWEYSKLMRNAKWDIDFPAIFCLFKKLGITDIQINGLFSDCGQGTVWNFWPEDIKPPMVKHFLSGESLPEVWKSHGINPIVLYGEQCRENGLGLWVEIHGLMEDWGIPEVVLAHKEFYAQEADGTLVKGYPYDLLNEKSFEFIKFQIDHIIEAFKPYGVLKGFYADEWHFNYLRNFLGGHKDKFKDFCQRNFGDSPSEALLAEKFTSKGWVQDTEDIWWRRYVIWKRHVVYNFEKRITDYIHSKGLKIVGRTQSAPGSYVGQSYSAGATSGHTFRLSELYDYEDMNGTDALWLDNGSSIFWLRGYDCKNRANVVNGHPTSYFYSPSLLAFHDTTSKYLTRKVDEEWKVPNAEKELMTMSRDSRRWQGGERLKDIAVLTCSERQMLWSKSFYNLFQVHEMGLYKAFSAMRPCDIIDLELPEYVKCYPNCLIPPDGVKNIAPKSLEMVVKHIENGALAIAIMSEWSTANSDITHIVDKTSEITGVKYGNNKGEAVNLVFPNQAPILAGLELKLPKTPFSPVTNQAEDVTTIAWLTDAEGNRFPAISQRKAGKGTLLSVHFDLARLLNDERVQSGFPVFCKVANALINHFGKSEALIVDGEARLAQSVIKNGDLAVTLLPRDSGQLPAFANIIPSHAIIVPSAQYDVNTLATGKAEAVNNKDGGSVWSGEELLKGIKVTIEKERGYQLLEIVKRK